MLFMLAVAAIIIVCLRTVVEDWCWRENWCNWGLIGFAFQGLNCFGETRDLSGQ